MIINEFTRIPEEDGVCIFYFKIFSSHREQELRLELEEGELIKWNCTCEYGSTFRFSQGNQDKTCKHVSSCLDLLKYLKHAD